MGTCATISRSTVGADKARILRYVVAGPMSSAEHLVIATSLEPQIYTAKLPDTIIR